MLGLIFQGENGTGRSDAHPGGAQKEQPRARTHAQWDAVGRCTPDQQGKQDPKAHN